MKSRPHFDREVRRARHFLAWITVGNRPHCECQVLDVSGNGAKIIAAVPSLVPLAFSEGGKARACEVIWRRTKMIGVRFI